MNASTALEAYKATKTQTSIEEASPHKLVAMLLDGALERISLAQGALERGEIASKCEAVSETISIVDSLRVSLDSVAGERVADNLEQLYDYMMRRLVEANHTNDSAMLGEVSALLRDIKGAWDTIPSDLHHASQPAP